MRLCSQLMSHGSVPGKMIDDMTSQENEANMRKNESNTSVIPVLFTVYYMNQEKVFEMRMLLDNQIKTGGSNTETSSTKGGATAEGNGEIKAPLIAKLKANAGGSFEHGRQHEMVDNLEYINTKSRLLADVMSKCVVPSGVLPEEGSLVYVPGIELELINESECRALVTVMNGTFDGLSVPEAQGLDIGHMMQSFTKTGASFKLTGKGKAASGLKNAFLKIPIDSADLFESHYSIDDLLIGCVDVIGIYKGEVSEQQLRSSYDYFQANSTKNKPPADDFIDGNAGDRPHEEGESEAQSNSKRSYIDILAIIQPVKTNQ